MDIKKVSFVEFERKRLFSLVARHKDIVQNRRTDSTSVHRKQLVWERITQEYNRHPNVRRRQTKQLKRLWQNSIARSKRDVGQQNTDNFLLLESIADLEANRSNASKESLEEVPSILETDFQAHTLANNCSTIEVQNQTHSENDETEESVEELLAPSKFFSFLPWRNYFVNIFITVLSARLRKVEDSIRHQNELHQMQLQREQIQLKGVQDDLQRKSHLHAQQIDREREVFLLIAKWSPKSS